LILFFVSIDLGIDSGFHDLVVSEAAGRVVLHVDLEALLQLLQACVEVDRCPGSLDVPWDLTIAPIYLNLETLHSVTEHLN
jgi:hypothetical protein